MLLFFEILFTIVIGASIIIYINQLRRYKAIKPITGPPLVPLIGNGLEFGKTPEDMYHDFDRLSRQNGKLFQIWIGPFAQYVIVSDPAIAEKIMNSSKHIDKMNLYDYLVPWLGYGLLISTGEKWRKRRKILTPAFHFTILEQSVENFNNASNIMMERLKKHINGDAFDIYPYVTLCGLDIICETAMGIQVNAQTNSESKYVCAVRDACNIMFERSFSIMAQSDFYFNYISKIGRLYRDAIKTLHATTDSVIKERRDLLLQEMNAENDTTNNVDNEIGKKKPMAFLDTLLKSTIDGKPLTNADIREEVDTFMFEGHDTVSSGTSFTIHLLANHPEIQKKCFHEIREICGDDITKVPTIAELNQMKYLEAVIKESMRLYPPVPMIGRQLTEDLHLDGAVLPNKTSVIIWIHWMQRQEHLFPDPHSFKPERFLDGRVDDKNYFAFIPFSAGPRNCIGQKFAMYEMKSTLSKLLRNYELLPAGPGHELKLAVAIIFKSTNGIPIKIAPRQYL